MDVWTFRLLRPNDLVRLHRWLNQPHVACWWGGAIEMSAVEAKYRPRIVRPAAVAPYLGLLGDQPMGYLQLNRVDLPAGYGPDTVGLDAFLGNVESLGKGLGAEMIGGFVRTIVFDDPRVAFCVVDPDPANTRAIESFTRAGFRPAENNLMVTENPSIASRGRGPGPDA
jgi:aminoglycoside 6'-N-acetyltransferase-1b/aminoglycoside 6'-N-acetyltransferase-2